MTYDTRNRILQIGVHEEVKLTNLEHKFLICLSSGDVVSYEEMTKYLKCGKGSLSILKARLERKTKFELQIKVCFGRGYEIINDIYFK